MHVLEQKVDVIQPVLVGGWRDNPRISDTQAVYRVGDCRMLNEALSKTLI